MALKFDIELSAEQKAEMEAIPAASWFTRVVYRNAASPAHPDRKLDENNELKQALVSDWVTRSVSGKRVLDLFSANGAFAFRAALAGASEVVGLDFSEQRVRCAQFVASTIPLQCRVEFECGDVYRLGDYFKEPFDVVQCFGGLYHIADPAFVLRQIRRVVTERLILQTSQVLDKPGNWAQFIVRREDRTQQGCTSIQGGYGTWHYTPECLRELLLHGGFAVDEERQPREDLRARFPWYLALCSTLPD